MGSGFNERRADDCRAIQCMVLPRAMEFIGREIQERQVNSEDLSHNPQAEVDGKSRDCFMQNLLLSLNQMVNQARKQAPEPIERLERQARSWAKFFEDMHRARWDIPVVQLVVDDTQSKEGWRGLLSESRYHHQRQTGNRAWAGRSPGGGRATLTGVGQLAGDVQSIRRPGGVDDVQWAKSTPLHQLPGGLDSGKSRRNHLVCSQGGHFRVAQNCQKVGIHDPKLSKTPLNLSETRENRVKKAILPVKNAPKTCQKPLFDVKNYGYSC